MLVTFSVENFKSFKNKVVLNMIAASITEHNSSNIIETPKTKLVKTAAIYGHNGSGKSNLLNALVLMRWLVINSSKDTQANEEIDVEPFLLSNETEKRPSTFEVVFILEDIKYRYGFQATSKTILKEWLLYTEKSKEYPLFLREENNYKIDNKLKEAKGLEKRTRPNALFLSVTAQFNVDCSEGILNWFYSIYPVHGLNDIEYQDVTLNLMNKDLYKDRLKALMKRADFGIEDIEAENTELDIKDILKSAPKELHDYIKKNWDKEDKKLTNITSLHNKFDKNKKLIDVVRFQFEKRESQGTQKFFNLLGVFVQAIESNSIVVIDEFDTRLHPVLVKTIVKLFNSSKIKTKAQLIFSTHYTSLLDRELLRRDQIYFMEKDLVGNSNLYSVIDFDIRKNSAIEKKYYEGKFGALPSIGDIEELFISN